MKPFTWVQDQIRALADNEPERVSIDSYFSRLGKPLCIVAEVLYQLAVRPGGDHQLCTPYGIALCHVSTLAHEIPWQMIGVEQPTPDEAAWISRVQQNQDNRLCWGEAVARADRVRC